MDSRLTLPSAGGAAAGAADAAAGSASAGRKVYRPVIFVTVAMFSGYASLNLLQVHGAAALPLPPRDGHGTADPRAKPAAPRRSTTSWTS